VTHQPPASPAARRRASPGAGDARPALERWGRRGTLAIVAAVALVAVVLWAGLLALRFEGEGRRFDFLRWEITSIPNKWLHALGAPLRDDPPADEAIARYFALDDRGGSEAAQLESAVEAAIEGRIDAVLHELGVEGRLPLPGSVFPPVDVELALPPRVLVTSPRDHIERVGDELLRPGMTREEATALERAVEERDPQLSALALRTGGVALYPAVVSASRSYEGTVGTAAHEWVHHYLAFYPLGASYFRSQELRTLNETVADVVGDEVAARVLDRFGDPTGQSAPDAPDAAASPGGPDAAASPEATAPDPRDERAAEALRALRLEVDELLAAGRIEQAELRMEQVRLELAGDGIVIRRINQAYFAWFGSYAARADSVDPLGDELRALRARLGSLDAFVDEVRGVTSRAQVRELSERIGAP
jgi:hypothetical protein